MCKAFGRYKSNGQIMYIIGIPETDPPIKINGPAILCGAAGSLFGIG
jgi:hypothetical protein